MYYTIYFLLSVPSLAYEEAISLKPQLDSVQFKVQLLRETHESEQRKLINCYFNELKN